MPKATPKRQPAATSRRCAASADSPDAQAFRNAAKAHQAYLQNAFSSLTTFLGSRADESGRHQSAAAAKPQSREDHQRASAGFADASPAATEPRADPLEPILDAPDFPQPMYEALRDLSQDFLFPGLEQVPTNTVTVLETNPKFVESFLVGLNAEMSRELLWRNYPTDQRGTYFRQFWDTSAGSEQPDIDMITNWGDRKLGENAARRRTTGAADSRRAAAAVSELGDLCRGGGATADGQLELSPDPAEERHPLFRGTLKPDVTFLGFDSERQKKPSPIPAGSSSFRNNRPSRASGWTSRTSRNRCRT